MKPLAVAVLALGQVLAGLAGAAHARPASSSTSWQVRVCTANVQNFPDMPDRDVRADVRTAKKHCDLILWQEIAEKADRRAVREVLGAGWKTTGHPTEVPISYRAQLFRKPPGHTSISVKVARGLGNCPDGRPSYSPARYATFVRLHATAGGRELLVANTHLPTLGKKGCRHGERRRTWQGAWERIDDRVDAARDQGRWVVAGADWNRRRADIEKMRGQQRWVTPAPNGLDHIFTAGLPATVRSRYSYDLHSDHPLRGAHLQIGARR